MKKEIIIAGAGGHAKVCIEILHAMGEKIDYCVGNDKSSEFCLNIPVLKGDHHFIELFKKGYSKIFIAVGSNILRKRLADFSLSLGFQLINAIHPTAILSPSINLGIGIAIMPGAILNAKVRLENLVIVNTGASIDHDCCVGEASHIGPQCALAGGVTVGKQCFLGINSCVIPEINIGNNVIVGGGSVVIRSITTDTTVAGVPALAINQHIT